MSCLGSIVNGAWRNSSFRHFCEMIRCNAGVSWLDSWSALGISPVQVEFSGARILKILDGAYVWDLSRMRFDFCQKMQMPACIPDVIKAAFLLQREKVRGRVLWLLASNPALFDGVLALPSWPFVQLLAKWCQFMTEVLNREKNCPGRLIWLTFWTGICTWPNSSWILNEMLPVQDNPPDFVEN